MMSGLLVGGLEVREERGVALAEGLGEGSLLAGESDMVRGVRV